MGRWEQLVTEIRRVETELKWLAPERESERDPHPGATEDQLRVAERRLGTRLPPSYRAFLRRHDGWPCFYDGVTLLGTAHLGRRIYEDLARSAFAREETPVPERLGPPSAATAGPSGLLPFGVDLRATTLFAFDLDTRDSRGECEVICWLNDLGLRSESFEACLESILELSQAELEATLARAVA